MLYKNSKPFPQITLIYTHEAKATAADRHFVGLVKQRHRYKGRGADFSIQLLLSADALSRQKLPAESRSPLAKIMEVYFRRKRHRVHQVAQRRDSGAFPWPTR